MLPLLCSLLFMLPKHTNYIKFNIVYAKHRDGKSLKRGIRMKVAILGAGLSGLACAIECERLGVQAEIFERG